MLLPAHRALTRPRFSSRLYIACVSLLHRGGEQLLPRLMNVAALRDLDCYDLSNPFQVYHGGVTQEVPWG